MRNLPQHHPTSNERPVYKSVSVAASIAYLDERLETCAWRPESQLPRPVENRFADDKRKPFHVSRLEEKPVIDVFRRLQLAEVEV